MVKLYCRINRSTKGHGDCKDGNGGTGRGSGNFDKAAKIGSEPYLRENNSLGTRRGNDDRGDCMNEDIRRDIGNGLMRTRSDQRQWVINQRSQKSLKPFDQDSELAILEKSNKSDGPCHFTTKSFHQDAEQPSEQVIHDIASTILSTSDNSTTQDNITKIADKKSKTGNGTNTGKVRSSSQKYEQLKIKKNENHIQNNHEGKSTREFFNHTPAKADKSDSNNCIPLNFSWNSNKDKANVNILPSKTVSHSLMNLNRGERDDQDNLRQIHDNSIQDSTKSKLCDQSLEIFQYLPEQSNVLVKKSAASKLLKGCDKKSKKPDPRLIDCYSSNHKQHIQSSSSNMKDAGALKHTKNKFGLREVQSRGKPKTSTPSCDDKINTIIVSSQSRKCQNSIIKNVVNMGTLSNPRHNNVNGTVGTSLKKDINQRLKTEDENAIRRSGNVKTDTTSTILVKGGDSNIQGRFREQSNVNPIERKRSQSLSLKYQQSYGKREKVDIRNKGERMKKRDAFRRSSAKVGVKKVLGYCEPKMSGMNCSQRNTQFNTFNISSRSQGGNRIDRGDSKHGEYGIARKFSRNISSDRRFGIKQKITIENEKKAITEKSCGAKNVKNVKRQTYMKPSHGMTKNHIRISDHYNRKFDRSSNYCDSDHFSATSYKEEFVNDIKPKRRSRTKKIQYEPYYSYSHCIKIYDDESKSACEPTLIRGKIRVLPGKNAIAFVSCDRGSLLREVLIPDEKKRNRALDGDYVFVELLPQVDRDILIEELKEESITSNPNNVENTTDDDDVENERLIEFTLSNKLKATANVSSNIIENQKMWHDDEAQVQLWNPVINLPKKSRKSSNDEKVDLQRMCKVVYIIPPKSSTGESELAPADENYQDMIPTRTILGTLSRLPDDGNVRYLLKPNNKSLPFFMCPRSIKDEIDVNIIAHTLFRAEYIYGSWSPTDKWPPCTRVTPLCGFGNVEDETKALLLEYGIDHGEFSPHVLRDVEDAVKSGRFFESESQNPDRVMAWKPTEDDCRGRRDYRNHRVFTIDPTTAKDLDDAVHIALLPDGRVEVGVHIADVSYFVEPDSALDEEALRRATTVYLVDRVLPMLPRPLCEVACSLNENVERLAFSCVWKMNIDGTMSNTTSKKKGSDEDDVWYGRTVIRSCARLDYSTAQNIIENKVAVGESEVDEALWPKSRQPTGGHTIDEVACDIRLMHQVAMARRKLRFENGALILNGIKLAFQFDYDGVTPKLCAPYPIRDSNRLIEEYMLLANFLVAQRLITHAKGRALLRQHLPPVESGLTTLVEVSKNSLDFDIDVTNSQTLQESLNRLTRTCCDELILQCVTEALMTPMRPAEYIAAGEVNEEDWQHYALNIPYYTHFTSPIRRYADIYVHRLLLATLEGTVDQFPHQQQKIHSSASHCNDKRMAAKKAQERSDRVFLSLFLKKNPIPSALGICLGVGEKSLNIFIPSLGMSARVFIEEHENAFDMKTAEDMQGRRILKMQPKSNIYPDMLSERKNSLGQLCTSLDIGVFTKLQVSCSCKDKVPIDVQVLVLGPWIE